MIYNDIQEYLALKPSDYRFLKSLSFTRKISREKYSRFNVDIVLSRDSGENEESLRIQCVNAFGIKVGDLEGMFGLLVEIEDVTAKQLEGGNYCVFEQEERSFSFYCENFFVELVR